MAKAKKGTISARRTKKPHSRETAPQTDSKKRHPSKSAPKFVQNRSKETFTRILLSLALLVLLCLAYSNSFQASFQFDDYAVVVNNTKIHSLSDWKSILSSNFFRPVLLYSFALNYHFSEKDPFGYHLVNFFLHLLNIFLYFS